MTLATMLRAAGAALFACGWANAQTWTQTNTPGFGDPYNLYVGAADFGGVLYAATFNQVAGTEVWQYQGGTSWAQINLNGWDNDVNNVAIEGAEYFGGLLYLSSDNSVTGTEVWRYDGTPPNWTQVNPDGFGSTQNQVAELFVHNASLHALTENTSTGCEAWRYNGSGTSWSQINADGFGNPNNRGAEWIVFNSNLYAATENFSTGTEILQYVSGSTWNRVDPGAPGPGGGGFDLSGSCNYTGSMVVYNGALYVATNNYCTGVEVWRYNGGTSWTQVNANGFGSSDNDASGSLVVYGGLLFCGTSNQPAPGIGGGELWKYDGSTWTPGSTPGFGDAHNASIDELEIHDNVLYATTENSFTGTEVWRYSGGSTWTQVNLDGFATVATDESGIFSHAGQLFADAGRSVFRADWTSYCTTKVNSLGCAPAIVATGASSASSTSGFTIDCTTMLNNKNGVLFYGISGQASMPFQGGTLCVAAPIKRTPAVNSGGNPPPNDCSGVCSLDMNAFAAGALGGSPLPALQVVGTTVDCQWWSRDPGFAPPNNTSLSNGLRYVVGP